MESDETLLELLRIIKLILMRILSSQIVHTK